MPTIRRAVCATLLLVLATTLAACGSSGGSGASSSPSSSPSASGAATLTDTSWTLDDTTPAAVPKLPDGVEVTASFTATAVSGSSGCNNYNGSYTATSSGSLTFGPLASTLKACEPAVNAVETAYLAALDKVTTYAIDGDELTLSGPNATVLLRYSRTTASPSP